MRECGRRGAADKNADGLWHGLSRFLPRMTRRKNASDVTAAVKHMLRICLKGAALVIKSAVSPGIIDHFVSLAIRGIGKWFYSYTDLNAYRNLKGYDE